MSLHCTGSRDNNGAVDGRRIHIARERLRVNGSIDRPRRQMDTGRYAHRIVHPSARSAQRIGSACRRAPAYRAKIVTLDRCSSARISTAPGSVSPSK